MEEMRYKMIEWLITQFHCRTPNFQNAIHYLEIRGGEVEKADTGEMRPGKSGQLVCILQERAPSSQSKHLKGGKERKVTLKICHLKFQKSHCSWWRAQTLQRLLAKRRCWKSLSSPGQIYSHLLMYSSWVTGCPRTFQKSHRRTKREMAFIWAHLWVNHFIIFLKYHMMDEKITESLFYLSSLVLAH